MRTSKLGVLLGHSVYRTIIEVTMLLLYLCVVPLLRTRQSVDRLVFWKDLFRSRQSVIHWNPFNELVTLIQRSTPLTPIITDVYPYNITT